jgi:DNA gyrase subunit A
MVHSEVFEKSNPVAGRATQGVIVLDTADEERVVSVDRVGETEGEEDQE